MANNDLVGRSLGQYTVLEQLGRGGMADVYKTFHPQLEVYRAIKVIRPEFVTAEDFRARFQKEAQAVAALRHPNIVQIHDFGEQDDAYYMVMEFIEGRDLKHIIREEGKIRPLRRAVDIIDQVAGALHYAHSQGLIHRDIKPENIMISDSGQPILMDFGIAKLLTANTQLTQTGMGVGTPAYMAPEQAKALPEIGPAVDIYSLSVVLYEMLTGRVPFSADTPMAVLLKAINDPMPPPRQFSDDITESMQQVLLKGTAKEANNRYQTARQFQEALQRALEDEAPAAEPAATEIIAEPVSDREVSREPAPGRPALYALAGVALAVVMGGASYWLLKPGAGEPGDAPPTQTQQAAADDVAEAGSGADDAAGGEARLIEKKTTTEPGKALSFDVEASRGDVVYLQVHDTTETTDFTLVTPDGLSEVFNTYRDHGPVTLESDGRYMLRALTRGERTAEIDITLWRVSPAVIEGGPLQWGGFIQGRTRVPGQAVSYTLDADSGQTVFFDLAEASETTDFTLVAPDGRTEVFQSYRDHGPLQLDQSGTYTLRADPRGDKVSEFEFNVWHVDPAVVDEGTLQFDRYVTGGTSIPGQVVSWSLDIESGQTLFFDLAEAGETTDFTLVAPDGRTEVFQTYRDHGPVTVEQSGTFRFTADPRADRTSEFEFNMRHVAPAVVDGGTVQLDSYVKGETSVAGQVASYSLNAEAGQELYFEVTETSETTDFALTTPDGRTEVFRAYRDHGPLTLDQSGLYELLVDPRADRVSQFEFRLWDLNTPVDGGEIRFGQNVQGEVPIPGQSVVYSLEADAGQDFYLDAVESSNRIEFELVAPDGLAVVAGHDDLGPVTLDSGGTHRLLVRWQGGGSAQFEFMVRSEG